jgi:hypothetical protein
VHFGFFNTLLRSSNDLVISGAETSISATIKPLGLRVGGESQRWMVLVSSASSLSPSDGLLTGRNPKTIITCKPKPSAEQKQ